MNTQKPELEAYKPMYDEDGNIVVRLKYSKIKTKSGELTDILTFHEPTAGELDAAALSVARVKKANGGEISPFGISFVAISTLASPKVSYAACKDLDPSDLTEVVKALSTFRSFNLFS